MTDVIQKCRVCEAPTANKCTSCKSVSYCGREHQREDWKTHKEECRPFQVRSTLELGRFLEATRLVPAGEVLFSELPIVFGPRPEDVVCLGCYSPNPQDRCPRCLWPACTSTCPGLTDPQHHGSECVIFQVHAQRVQYVAENFFRYDVILPLRCLLLQRRNPKNWKIVTEMEAHTRKRGPNTDVYKHVNERVVKYLDENFFRLLTEMEMQSGSDTKLLAERSPEILQKLCGIIDVNALEIQLPNGGALNALYPTAYLMEHNCLPNTRHTFQCRPGKGFKIKVFANQDIQQGSHISTMYTHALWGTQQRQDHLRSMKFFTCRCKRCGDPSELGTNLSALRCLAPGPPGGQKTCGGTQLPSAPLDAATFWQCDTCSTSLTSAQVFEFVNMIRNEVEAVQEKRPSVESLEILLGKLRKLLHKNHFHCYSVMHSLVQLYGRQPGYLPHQMNDVTVEKKMKMCKQLLDVTLTLDPTGSRLSLYASILEQELAASVLLLASRQRWTGPELVDRLREARTHLVHAAKALQPEEEGTPAAKFTQVVASTLAELDAHCRTLNIVL